MMEEFALFACPMKYFEAPWSEGSNSNSNEKTFRFIPDQSIH